LAPQVPLGAEGVDGVVGVTEEFDGVTEGVTGGVEGVEGVTAGVTEGITGGTTVLLQAFLVVG